MILSGDRTAETIFGTKHVVQQIFIKHKFPMIFPKRIGNAETCFKTQLLKKHACFSTLFIAFFNMLKPIVTIGCRTKVYKTSYIM